ncbi:hypothetical protein [Paenibacillus sp. IHBB 10380]|uniref:hypothetical protein n=1 Tax=Paenibacillus sp. IHBB 10380 TaxID=1566358 RepID=UPI0005CF9C3E|nr:hypothetical protein [Paenibacillus sp. IHBB 10380]AJS59536.1 hypothetical protein UB51_14880 [Paenibacillus sp. IHBB 10380]
MLQRPKLTGRIGYPGDPGYSKERLDSNYYYSKDKFPHVIVYCQKPIQTYSKMANLSNETQLSFPEVCPLIGLGLNTEKHTQWCVFLCSVKLPTPLCD